MLVESILSGIVGLIIGVLFQDAITRLVNRIKNGIKRAYYAMRKKPLCPAEEFEYGKRKTSVIIVDGDGRAVYDVDKINAIIVDNVEPENDYIKELDYFQKKTEEEIALKKANNERVPWNGKTVSLWAYRIDCSSDREKKVLNLSLALNDYYRTYSVITYLDQICPETNRKLKQYIDDYDYSEPVGHYCLPNSMGICLQVVTSDFKTIYARRSLNSGYRAGEYDISVVEGLNESDISNDNKINFYAVAKRSINEEICELSESEMAIHLLGLLFDKQYNQWNIIGVADLKIPYTEVNRRRRSGVSGRWELRELSFVNLDLGEIFDFLSKHKIWDMGLVTNYLALVFKQFNRNSINRMIEKYQKNH